MPSNGLPSVRLVGVGAALPTPCLSNDDLSQIVETSDEWIWPRTGIRQRRILPPDLSLVDLAAQAAKAALAQAGIPPQELDLILLATSTGVDRFGSAPRVQAALGATRAVAFDLTAACTGFVFAVATAAQFLQTGLYRRALVVAADVLSRTVDWTDRTTCVLFGTGQGRWCWKPQERGTAASSASSCAAMAVAASCSAWPWPPRPGPWWDPCRWVNTAAAPSP